MNGTIVQTKFIRHCLDLNLRPYERGAEHFTVVPPVVQRLRFARTETLE